jgi:hypothetical protein
MLLFIGLAIWSQDQHFSSDYTVAAGFCPFDPLAVDHKDHSSDVFIEGFFGFNFLLLDEFHFCHSCSCVDLPIWLLVILFLLLDDFGDDLEGFVLVNGHLGGGRFLEHNFPDTSREFGQLLDIRLGIFK